VFHILSHATFKASLFMAAGIVDHETGARDMRKLHGLRKYMPWTGRRVVTQRLPVKLIRGLELLAPAPPEPPRQRRATCWGSDLSN